VTPQPTPQRAATDSEKAAARETAALLKPLMDDIDHKLDQVLEAIAAIAAHLNRHLAQGTDKTP
jgi:hypothetical protein